MIRETENDVVRVTARHNIFAGLALIVLAAVFFWQSFVISLDFVDEEGIGPRFFPQAICTGLALIGAALVILGLRQDIAPADRSSFVGQRFLFDAVACFALLLAGAKIFAVRGIAQFLLPLLTTVGLYLILFKLKTVFEPAARIVNPLTLLGLKLGSSDGPSEPRFDFGMVELYNGFSLVPLLIGMFVISEVFTQVAPARKGQEQHDAIAARSPDDDRLSWAEFLRCLPYIGRGSAFGSMVGLIPGVGSAVACFVAYGSSKAKAPNKEEWGKGAIEGVAAPEASNNAVSGPSMIPLLALGVPGSTIAAMLMGVFMIHGIQVGPKIFETSGDTVYGLFAAGLTGIVLYGLIGWFGGPLIGRIIDKVPQRLIYPTIFAVALISAYTARSSMFDVVVALIFGLVGYFMRTLNFSPAAAIIAFVLAPGAEQALRQSVLLTDDGFGIFLTRPVALAFFAVPVVAIGIRIFARMRSAQNAPDATGSQT
jgi:TctA family transporter